MENRISFLSIVVPVFLLCLLQGCVVHVKGDVALIKDTCHKTLVPDFCVSFFLANSSSLGADLFGLATISMEALVSNVTVAQPVVAELARKATELLWKRALCDCSSSYLEGIHWGGVALSQLRAKDFSDANPSAGAVNGSVVMCHDVFDQFKLPFPPVLNGFQQSVSNLADVAITIVSILTDR